MLPVIETFYSLQGEGYFAGSAAFFIRLAGCPVQCDFCDEQNSWSIDEDSKVDVEDIVGEVVESGAKCVVVTGGEPIIHRLQLLTNLLRSYGIRTHLETSGYGGTLTGTWDWITFSPKKIFKPSPEFYQKANELKIVIEDTNDFDFAEYHHSLSVPDTKFYLQPEWSNRDEIIPMIIEYIKLHPQWRLSLQIHKYLDIS
ncbi:MAG: 7-carboxy-7-deazaguanine synthase QueE [Bacteroidales bacterium]|jgi:organic radical activating enzyme|nr:7-carboxy-7-deazaguanine synthase QueE [Bacteroidales bacterium]